MRYIIGKITSQYITCTKRHDYLLDGSRAADTQQLSYPDHSVDNSNHIYLSINVRDNNVHVQRGLDGWRERGGWYARINLNAHTTDVSTLT